MLLLPGASCKSEMPSCIVSMGCSRVLGASLSPSFPASFCQHFGLAISEADVATLRPYYSIKILKVSPLLDSPPRSTCSHICRAVQCARRLELKGNRWKGRTPKRWQQRSFVRCALNSDQNPLGDESFWDQAEGKKKLNEIEDMKELLSEAKKLQSEGDERTPQVDASSEVSQEEQAQKLSEELARRAKEQAERRKQAEQMFQLGQRAYGRGMYDKSVELFEAALTNIPGASHLGGEVQVWLAMAYEADNKHSDCIALYKKLENTHPSRSIRSQAKDLRYILEAPKLKISKEEMVSIPLIDPNNDSDTRTWSQMYRERKKKLKGQKIPATRDYLADWLVWNPPRWERSPYFWVAVTLWLTLVGISLMFQD